MKNRRREKRKKRQDDEPDIIIDGGILLTMVDGQEPISPANILIKGDKIIDVLGPDEDIADSGHARIIDAKNAIIMPGLVNAHSHTAMTIFRGFADDLPLKQWLYEKIFPAEANYINPDTVYWGTLLGCLEMIGSGTTTVIDGYFYQDDTVRAVKKSGLRALLAQGVIDFPAPGVSDPKENLKAGRQFIERWRDESDVITPGLFCHSPLTCSRETLRKSKDVSEAFSLPLQIHLSETAGEVDEIMRKTGLRPVHYLDSLGLLDDALIASHAVHLNEDEIERLSGKGVRIVNVPESNMKLTSGIARIDKMVNMGMTVGIGTDGCASNNNLDLFQEMDTAAKIHKVHSMNPVVMDAETILRMATSWGAKILGLENDIGTIEVGKKADIIVVGMENPHFVPLYHPMSTLVYAADGGDVKDVIVNGRILMENRSFKTLNPEEIMGRVTAISRDIVA